MTDIKSWSITASQNNDPVPNGFPEQMAPSGVNDAAREVMAAVRRRWNDAEWFDYGAGDKSTSYSFVSSTVVKVVGGAGVIGEYHAGRRVRYVGAVAIYGTIQSSVTNAADLDVTISWDSGNAINESFTLFLSILRADNSNLPEGVTIDVNNRGDHTGNVIAPDGSEAAPSITNDGDTDTGRFYPAADTIAESTGGVERERLDNTQKTLSVPLQVPNGNEVAPSIHGDDIDSGVRFGNGQVHFPLNGNDGFSFTTTTSGPSINIALAAARRLSGFVGPVPPAEVVFDGLPLLQERQYLLFVMASEGANNGPQGLYLLYRRSASTLIHPILANPNVTVSVNGSDEVVVTSITGAQTAVTCTLTCVNR